MIRLLLVALLTLLSVQALAQGPAVTQSGTVTPGQVPRWVSNNVIGGGNTAADSQITTFGVTANSTSAMCLMSARQSAAGRNILCMGAQTSGVGRIYLSNQGTADAQDLEIGAGGNVKTTSKLVSKASALASAGFNLTPGVAPNSPTTGDVWMTSLGMYYRIGGTTVGPLAANTPPATRDTVNATLSADVTNWSPSGYSVNTSWLRVTSTGTPTPWTITSIVAQTAGDMLYLTNVATTGRFTLVHTAVPTTNQMYLGNDVTVNPGQTVCIVYDTSNYWRPCGYSAASGGAFYLNSKKLVDNDGSTIVGYKPDGSTTAYAITSAATFLNGTTIQAQSDGGLNYVNMTSGGIVLGAGTVNQLVQVDRAASPNNNGFALSVVAGGARSGQSNADGGTLVLSSGIATGNGSSSIDFRCVAASQGAGSTDRTPATCATMTSAGLTLTAGGFFGAQFSTNGAGNPIIGTGSVITNPSTTGYAMLPGINTTPSGSPSFAGTGAVPVVFDTTNHVPYFYSGSAWRRIALSNSSGIVLPANGGTGIANGTNNTITFTGNFTFGATLSNNTSVTFPTSGTLATLAGSEALTGKTYNGLTVTTTTGTLTLANSSSLITSGGNSLTLTTSGTTNVTFPSGTNTLAQLDSPTFTGTPASTTAAVSTNTTQIATTAFVMAQFAVGGALLSKTSSIDYDVSTTGTLTVSDVGFQATSCTYFTTISGTAVASWGTSDSAATAKNIYFGNSSYTVDNNISFILVSVGNAASLTSLAYTSNGFTATKTKVGSPTGTARVTYTCYR